MPKLLIKPFLEHLKSKTWKVEKLDGKYKITKSDLHFFIYKSEFGLTVQRIYQLNDFAKNNRKEFLEFLEPLEIKSDFFAYYMEKGFDLRMEMEFYPAYNKKDFDETLKNIIRDLNIFAQNIEFRKYILPENKNLTLIQF